MTRSVSVSVDGDLVVTVASGEDDWDYRVTVAHDGDDVTEYGSNFAPWSRAGVTILRNIVTTRIEAYGSRDRVEGLLEDAFAGRSAELEAVDGD